MWLGIIGILVCCVAFLAYYLWLRRDWHGRVNSSQLDDISASVSRLQAETQRERTAALRRNALASRTKYVGIPTFDENGDEWCRAIAQIAAQPEWHWFLWVMEQHAFSTCKNAGDLEQQRRAIAWIEAFDLIAVKMGEIAQKYDAMTNQQPEEDEDGEISLS